MPDISKLKPKVVPCFLAASLVRDLGSTIIEKKMLPILARLTDKAIAEYRYAREYIEAEAAETRMTYEEIMKRDHGQLIYTCTIINHLENCITTLARIYKIKETHLKQASNEKIIRIRNAIEHVDERIRESDNEPPVLNISEDSLAIEVAARNEGKVFITTNDLAEAISGLYKETMSLIT